MQYRKGTIKDLDAITELIRSAIAHMEEQGIHQWNDLYPVREDFEDDIRKDTLYVGILEERLCAVYVLSQECDEEYGNCTWEGKDEEAIVLHRFCLSPSLQHQHLSKGILQHIEQQAKDMGCRSMRLDVFTENPAAKALYMHDGFVPRGTARWPVGSFILLEKRL